MKTSCISMFYQEDTLLMESGQRTMTRLEVEDNGTYIWN